MYGTSNLEKNDKPVDLALSINIRKLCERKQQDIFQMIVLSMVDLHYVVNLMMICTQLQQEQEINLNFLSNNSFIFLLIKLFFTHNLEICLPDVLIFVTVFFTSLFFFKRNYFGIFYENISILNLISYFPIYSIVNTFDLKMVLSSTSLLMISS